MPPHHIQRPTRHNLLRAQTVLIEIIRINPILTQSRITIAVPTATQIQLIVNTPDTKTPANHQPQSIILPIARIRDLNLPQHPRIESPRRPQPIDAQRIVTPILSRPLPMVNQPRRQRLQIKVTHPVRPDHHRSPLLVKLIHDPLQRILPTIKVITVQLHHKTPHTPIVHRQIPAPPDPQVITLRHDMNHPPVSSSKPLHNLRRPVRAPIVHHHQIKRKRRPLPQHTPDGISNRTHTVPHRNHHRSLHRKIIILLKPHHIKLPRVQKSINRPQMTRTRPLHLHLPATIPHVHIVKLLLPRQTRIHLHLRIQKLTHMHRQPPSAQPQTQVIQARKPIAMQPPLRSILLQLRRTHQQQPPHLEIVPHTTLLIVNQRHRPPLPVRQHDIMIRIQQQRIAVTRHRQHSLQSMKPQPQPVILRIDQHIRSRSTLSYLTHRASRAHPLHQMKHIVHQRISPKLTLRITTLLTINPRNKAINHIVERITSNPKTNISTTTNLAIKFQKIPLPHQKSHKNT